MNRKIILIFGRTGSGKSYLVKKMISKLKRVIVIDMMHEYEDGVIFNNLRDLILNIVVNKPSEFKYICRFETDEEIERLFQVVWYLKDLVLVVEEAEIYISPYKKRSWFLDLVRYGRHRGISIIAIARRVVELSPDIRANADTIISFKQILQKDLEQLEKLGFNKSEVMNLKEHEYKKIVY